MRPGTVERFPFPFTSGTFRYSTNVEPAPRPVTTAAGSWGGTVVDVGDSYRDELELRGRILRADPSRCTVLPHMWPACWDALLYLLGELAADHPEAMAFERDGRKCRWRNDLLGVEKTFTIGDRDSLPGGPLRFAGEQVQEDLVLLDQREDELWADAGLVTFAADWSLAFDVGMAFQDVHGPVPPRVHEEGVFTRAERFLMRLQPGQAYRRTNWSMTAGHRLDTSTENAPAWTPERERMIAEAPDGLPERLHLRVEVQHVVRLAPSGAVLFLIRTYLLSLRDLARVPQWRRDLASVLDDLPEDVADYKGLTRFRRAAVDYLRATG
ncbi:hypothetical protein Acsp03_62960 [Actinomadura sp. NBRC 104412]|uniref:heme-dependent oxidative N-demethylase family protein n=1 Tax=Actinomadura sp. NBRC 104412 TaxID=3032203 RepID=UPI0024A07619|nr:DUF3445 domain-containing protein [Actinomadura sp. NBRC 104412]GLZ08830.1 hypothetical protein Acsp03_62960 [Actinomadura sp. NBRC 104412]